jgi:hypothetical protein
MFYAFTPKNSLVLCAKVELYYIKGFMMFFNNKEKDLEIENLKSRIKELESQRKDENILLDEINDIFLTSSLLKKSIKQYLINPMVKVF